MKESLLKTMENCEIKPYQDIYRAQILKVWENSVLATHDFLTPSDFKEIKEIVGTIDFNAFSVYCLVRGSVVMGFLGVAENKVEMLFLDPLYIGQGYGKRLLDFAVKELKSSEVDVNEQNEEAVKFYQKFGFKVFERTEKDDQGRNYSLLRMRLLL